MKKRRGMFWRWLLSLVLGAGTWWGVGWWITPRVHFEATYQSQAFTKPAKAVMNALGFEVDTSYIQWDVNIWDRQGRYLLIGTKWAGRVPNCYDLIDLQTGKTLVNKRLTATKLEFDDHWRDIRKAQPNGDNFGFKYQSSYASDDETRDRLAKEILNGSIVFRLDRERRIQHGHEFIFRTELWSWNALSNQEKLIRPFSVNSQLKICHDGTTLLEIERVTPLLPNFLLPLSLNNVLTAQVTAEMGLEDLAIMRVWNLPALTLRSTINVPWMYRQGQAEITDDGSYVVLRDVNLPREFISKHHYQYEFTHHQYRSIQDAYASSPTGMRVHETRTGSLWWEKSDSPGFYSDYDQPGNNFVQFFKSRESLLKQPLFLLHLPSRQLIETMYCESAGQLAGQRIQIVNRVADDKHGYDIHVIGDGGSPYRFQYPMEYLRFIPDAPQFVAVQDGTNGGRLPAWMQAIARSIKWLGDWMEAYSRQLVVIDYSAYRTLISIPVETDHRHQVDFQVTDRWLLVRQSDEDGLKVSVYSIPFPSWSPVWPFTASLVVFLVTCYLLRQRRLQQG